MDESRFDAWARTWAARSTRRTALRRGIGGLAAGLGFAGWRSGGNAAQSATPVAVATPPAPADAPIDHIVVIYMENHPFDNLYGFFPGANGLESPGAQIPQVDLDGKVYDRLPQPINADATPAPDTRFPADLPNAPFPLDQYVALDEIVPSPVHRFYQHQLQMNGGKMDKYVAYTDSGGLVMGYHDTWDLPLYSMATQYTLCDNFFTGAFGGSLLNHLWLVCACTPTWPNPPADVIAEPVFDADGRLTGLTKDGDVTPDGYFVNNAQPFATPFQAGTPDTERLPPSDLPTIGDRLSAAGVDWAWYAGGWNDAIAGNPAPTFVFHHQPFDYFAPYGEGTPGRAAHLKDDTDFLAGVAAGALPAVSFIKPLGIYDEHAGYSAIESAEGHVLDLIARVQNSSLWAKTAIIITYDDFGGWYDHVPPPVVDRWGPGGRVPTLIVSPYARRGFVDHTLYDTTSILRFIEWRFGLAPLTGRDAAANNLLPAFDFTQDPAATPASATPVG